MVSRWVHVLRIRQLFPVLGYLESVLLALAFHYLSGQLLIKLSALLDACLLTEFTVARRS